MRKHAWSGQLLCGVLLSLAASVAAAQEEPSQNEELQDLKRRLEILEKEKEARAAKDNALPAATLMDPAEDKWWDKVKVGGGVRASFRSVTQGAPNGHNPSTDFALESGRLYTGGKITEWLSATLNAEFTANHSVATPVSGTPGTLVTGSPQVLDAIAEFKIANEFHIFVGRMLPATDRSNSDGPYYLATWDFPFLSDGFNAAGQLGDRDDGVTLWGDVGNFKYWVGAYEGSQANNTVGHDSLLYAARVQYDFMDAETGYYLTSTYYGDKKILALGLVANYQRLAAGNVVAKPMGNVAVDFLWEQKLEALGGCTPTVELAYYYFGRHGMDSTVSAVGPFDTGAGTGFLALVGVLIPGKVGWGQFQPHIRYQGFTEASAGTAVNATKSNVARWDFGVNYVMVGHNARVSLIYTHTTHRDLAPDKQEGMLTLGTQFQF
jgi:hypothetical protein